MRGIEELLAGEIRRSGRAEAVGIGHREVRFNGRAGPWVRALATADDVFVLGAEVAGVGGGRSSLARLRAAAEHADLERVLDERKWCGGRDGATCVDVSASFLGRRAYSRYDLEDVVGSVLARRLGVPYHSRRGGARAPSGGLSWRVTLVGDEATIALRIADRPLHRRPYKIATVPGTLHPPLAAAMVALAAPAAGQVVLDPCCGAGTLAIEAARTVPAARVLGSDADASALAAAVANGRCADVRWTLADGGALPVGDGQVDRVLLNPPWDRQVRPLGLLAGGPARLWREVQRVLGPDGRVVALLPGPSDVPAGFAVERELPVSLFGAHPVIVVARRA